MSSVVDGTDERRPAALIRAQQMVELERYFRNYLVGYEKTEPVATGR